MLRSHRDDELRRLKRLAQTRGSIVAGPWAGSLGLELLYWIPFLRWLTTEGGVDPSRVVAVSRGGVDDWYAPVARRFVDLFDHFAVPRVMRRGVRFDRQALGVVRSVVGSDGATVLHPRALARFLGRGWEGGGATLGQAPAVHVPLRGAARPDKLPEKYAAVKLYFNESLPDTPENRAVLQQTVDRLAAQTDVVVLPEAIGEHETFAPPRGSRVHPVAFDPAQNLAVQAQIVRHATVLVSTYGGFAFLGPYVATPTLALYSAAPKGIAHLDLADRVGRRLGNGTPLFRARHVDALHRE